MITKLHLTASWNSLFLNWIFIGFSGKTVLAFHAAEILCEDITWTSHFTHKVMVAYITAHP